MADNSRALNRVFTRGVIKELIENGSSDVFDDVVRRYVDDHDSKTHGELFSEIYSRLGKERRNEYYYMNTLLNILLVGIHSVNTTTALSQVRIGNHIADFVMINGEGLVYEIKSDLDNFDRLYEQLVDYYKAFSKVSVLSSIHELDHVGRVLSGFGEMGDAVGIYVLSERSTIFGTNNSRKPEQYRKKLDHDCIFKLMRKREYESLITSQYGSIPQTTPVLHFRACLEQFRQIPILAAQNLTYKELKKRNRISKADFQSVSSELKSVVYFSNLSNKLADIEKLLQTTYGR